MVKSISFIVLTQLKILSQPGYFIF